MEQLAATLRRRAVSNQVLIDAVAACDRVIHMRDGVIVGEEPITADAVA